MDNALDTMNLIEESLWVPTTRVDDVEVNDESYDSIIVEVNDI